MQDGKLLEKKPLNVAFYCNNESWTTEKMMEEMTEKNMFLLIIIFLVVLCALQSGKKIQI